MAGYACSLCDEAEQATLLITPLAGGETMAVGEGCMAVAFTGMLAGHLQLDPDQLWDALTALQQAIADQETAQPPAGPQEAAQDGPGPKLAAVPGAADAPAGKAKARPARPRRPRAASTTGKGAGG